MVPAMATLMHFREWMDRAWAGREEDPPFDLVMVPARSSSLLVLAIDRWAGKAFQVVGTVRVEVGWGASAWDVWAKAGLGVGGSHRKQLEPHSREVSISPVTQNTPQTSVTVLPVAHVQALTSHSFKKINSLF